MIKFFLLLIHNSISFSATVIGILGLSISFFWQTWLGIAVILIGLVLAVSWHFFIKPPILSHPPSHRNLQGYFAGLEKDFTAWTKRLVIDKRQQRWERVPVYAEEMRFYTAISLQAPEEENEHSLRRGQIESLRQQLRDNQEFAMILTGQAGLGKTTSLRYLVYQDYHSYQPGLPIPIYLELKNACLNQSLFDWIVCQLRIGQLARVPQLATVVEQWLENGYINLFLDGWNEISSPELEDQLFREVEILAQKYRRVFIIVTAREIKPLFEPVPLFALQNMDKEQIFEFIDKNTETQVETELRQTISQRIDQPRFLEFIQIPLYALMLIQIVRGKQEIPNNQVKVVDIFINRLLERDKLKWRVTEKRLGMKLDTFKSLLAYLAYVCVFGKGQQNTGLSAAEIRDILREYQPQMVSLNITYQWLKITVELGIMVYSQLEEKYSFTHQEYQAYFAGLGHRIFESGYTHNSIGVKYE